MTWSILDLVRRFPSLFIKVIGLAGRPTLRGETFVVPGT